MGSETGYIFGVNGRRTICEVFRDINDQFQGDSETDRQARDLVVNGMLLSKRMVGILARFKGKLENFLGTISDEFFDLNTAEFIKKAKAIRYKPGYKVGGKYN